MSKIVHRIAYIDIGVGFIEELGLLVGLPRQPQADDCTLSQRPFALHLEDVDMQMLHRDTQELCHGVMVMDWKEGG